MYQVMRLTVDSTLCHKVDSGRIQRSIFAGWSSTLGHSVSEIQKLFEPNRTGMRTCIFLAKTVCPRAYVHIPEWRKVMYRSSKVIAAVSHSTGYILVLLSH